MAEGLNRVLLLGNLGADPELRSTAGGQSVLKFRVATTESYLDRNRTRQERTEWHNVVIWGRRAEGLAKILNKGTRLCVEGSLRTSSYDDRDGNKRYRTEVIGNNVVLCGGRASSPTSRDEDPSTASTTAQPGGAGYEDADYGGGSDDDFPF